MERYVDDNFYSYSRGEFLVALTNQDANLQRTVTYLPFASGTVVCNVFYPTTDCPTVTSAGLTVYLDNGEAKIYVPKNSATYNELIANASKETFL